MFIFLLGNVKAWKAKWQDFCVIDQNDGIFAFLTKMTGFLQICQNDRIFLHIWSKWQDFCIIDQIDTIFAYY